MSELAHGSIFASAGGLPRGPHTLTREQVAESQRTRLMAAVTRLLAERGVARVTVGGLAREAGVSLATFYEHFSDKTDCMFAAYDHFAEVLAGAAGMTEATSWEGFVEAAIGHYLDVLRRDPIATRAFFVEFDAAGPAARRRRSQGLQTMARLFTTRYAEFRRRDPTLGPVPDGLFLALALSVRGLVYEALVDAADPALADLAPLILALITAVRDGTCSTAGAVVSSAAR